MREKNLIISVVVVLIVTWLTAFFYYSKLPEMIPTHWNIDGQIDDYTSKPWGVYMLPSISTATTLLLLLLPKISPKGFRLDSALRVYYIITLLTAMFLLGIMLLMFHVALGKPLDITAWILAGTGALMMIIGNFLSKVPKNFFLGIRTPWTLASDKVWYKTHRLGAWVFILSGLVIMIAAFTGASTGLILVLIGIMAIVPILYSLYVYKKLEGFGGDEN
ncbi:SdpI family protein [Marinicella gelatinilytica]|uniref:SdpI family protein n=1 Tax=Marinicella gelatinilytica TaxID=2996017 RepID=UPI00226090A5|nr:SdpI family protein [Marinicella gelatinilytica]MCX7543897.1 SdpI family protein [Marinicella gelatinilytica]